MGENTNKIICGDSLELIKNIPNESIDFFLTDPPYGTNDDKGKTIKRGNFITDFNVIEWDKDLPIKYIDELPRIMKNNTWGVIFTDNKEITTIWNKLESVELSPRNTFYWIKTNKAPTPRSNFKSCVETAVVFTKGTTSKKWYGGGNVNNYFESPFVIGKEHIGHDTQKPIALFEHLIGLFTTEGDLVFDPFIGSGTTAYAARKSGRNYLGMEIDPYWCGEINKRIKNIPKYKKQKFI